MDAIEKHLIQVSQGIGLLDRGQIETVVNALGIVRKLGGTVYLCGNGGSSALASHFTNDLIKIGRVRAVCLSDNVPVMTAYGNDTGWNNMFSGPLERCEITEKDALIGISCSGNSGNVLKAMEYARERAGFVIGLTGMGDGAIVKMADLLVTARVPDMRVQEDLHTIACHAIARALQEAV